MDVVDVEVGAAGFTNAVKPRHPTFGKAAATAEAIAGDFTGRCVAITERIGKALIADAGISQAWTGGQSVNDAFAWSSGPLQGQNLNATGNGLTADGLVNTNTSTTQRFLMEFGQSELATPASLASDLDPAAAGGNALVFEQSGLAYSQSTGHYYKLDGQTRDFAAAINAAETGTVQSENGYLARLGSLDELEIGGWFARQRSKENVWLGLYQTDTSSEPSGGWQWTSGDAAGLSDSDYSLSGFERWLPSEPDGDTPASEISSDGFAGGSSFNGCLLYTSPSPRDGLLSRMPSSA